MIPFSGIYLIIMIGLSLLYWIVPDGLKPKWMIVSGAVVVVFFAPGLIPYLIFSIVVNFIIGNQLTRDDKGRKKQMIRLAVFINVFGFGIYHFGKPFIGVRDGHFFISIGAFLMMLSNISYLIEQYRGNFKQSVTFEKLALYTLFFPKVLVGPLQDPIDFIGQFQKPAKMDKNKIAEGALLILWGIFQKVAIADRLATIVNPVFSNPQSHFGIELILASICLFLQLYCDYCAFVDISVGCSRMMNIELKHHFNMPIYIRKNRSFWMNYHMPLRRWGSKYLFKRAVSEKPKFKGELKPSSVYFYVKEGITIALGIILIALIRNVTFENMVIYMRNIVLKISNGLNWGKLCLDLGLDSVSLLKVLGAIAVLWFISTWHNMRRKDYPEAIYQFTQLDFWKAVEINFILVSFLLLGVFKESYFIAAF